MNKIWLAILGVFVTLIGVVDIVFLNNETNGLLYLVLGNTLFIQYNQEKIA